jgi:NADPH:quinone reductase-like Zn-dependent oxidoreductase
MNAIQFSRFGPPEVMVPVERPTPIAAAGEVLIEIVAASITPGDAKLRAGLLQGLFPLTLPCIPGRDGAGRVVACGPGVDYAVVGDALCFVADRTVQGSYASHIVLDAESIVPLPDTLGFVEGAALMHAGTCAWIALTQAVTVRAGERLLIHGGAGAIGGMAVQLGKHLGAWVAATCSARNVDYVRGLGADHAIAYDRESFWEDTTRFDVVLDLIGGPTHERSCAVLRRGGAIVWLIAKPFIDRSAEFGVRSIQAKIVDSRAANEAVVALAARGVLKPQVSRVMPLAAAPEAHRLIEAGDNSRGRIVLEI